MGSARRELIPGKALETALRRGVPSLVVLAGEEEFQKGDALRQIRERLGAGTELESFDGPRNEKQEATFDPAAVFDALRTGSLFASSRVVAVRQADRFAAAHGTFLAEVVEALPAGVVLVLFLGKLDGRTRLAKVVTAKGLKVTCRKLYDRPAPWQTGRVAAHDHELARWAVDRARLHGKRLRPEIAHELTEHTGNDLGRVAGALETLALYVGDRPEIDRSAVDQLVAGAGEQTVFRFCDQVLDRDGPAALRTLATMYRRGLDMGGKVQRTSAGISMIVLSWMARRMRELYRARRALEDGTPRAEVTERYGPGNRAFLATFERQLGSYPAKTLRRALSALRELELALKSGGAPAGGEILLEALVADICRRPEPRPTGRPAPRGHERERPAWA